MAVSFVIGRAGSGKSQRCFASIVEALRREPLGPPVYWLVPRQATFTAERRLTCESGLGGFLRARVISFEQLGHDILAECGGASIPEVTPIGRQMILGHLLRRHAASLKFFRSVASQPGLAAKLDATFAELERCGKDAADLDTLLNDMAATARPGDDGQALLDKVHDLHLIYNAYTAYLGQDRLDQHQRLLQVLGCLDDSTRFRNATVFADGFTDFSEYERRVLARLGKVCRRVEIMLTMDPKSRVIREPDLFPEETSLFHPVEMAYRRLRIVFREESVPVDDPPVLLMEVHRFAKASLRAAERHAFGTAIVHVQRDATGIEMVEAPTPADEVNAAARRIKQLLADGLRLRDIAVIVRDLSAYHDPIGVSFAEHGIRCFVDRRRQTAHHPLLQFVRAVLVIAQQPWPHEWLMTLLKTDLTGIAPADADALENYVLAHRIRGEQWAAAEPWAFHEKTLLVPEDSHVSVASSVPSVPSVAPPGSLVDAHRRLLIDPLAQFNERARGDTVREIVAALFKAIERFPVRRTIAAWMDAAKAAGEFEQMNEHAQVWRELVELFDQLVDLLGDERVPVAGFQEILEAGLEQFDLALTPPTVDEVLVGQVDRTRPPALRAVLVLGLNQGCFPLVPHEDSVLSDSDRRELNRRHLDVTPATERRMLDEDLLGYRALTWASETLYLSRSLSDAGGKPLGPSVYWQRMIAMFRITPTVLPREQGDDASLIATPRQLVTALMRWVRNRRGMGYQPMSSEGEGNHGLVAHATSDPLPALYQWLATHPSDAGPIDAARRAAWPALSYVNDAALLPDIAGPLFASPLRGGVTQLETFAACPFKHFLQYGLQLTARDDREDVSGLDLGHVFHAVLERVVGDLLKQRKSWADLTDPQKEQRVAAAVERIGHSLRGEIMLSTARNRYLLQRIERTLGQVIATQKAADARGRFRPGFSGLRFGDGETLPAFTLPTPKNRQVQLSGKIDRVDLHADGDEFTVIDYRLGERTLPLDQVYHGLSLQLLTYLLVLEANGQALAGRKLTPAAAFYVRMLRWLGDVAHPSEALAADNPAFHLAAKPRGLLDQRFLRAMDGQLQDGEKSDVVYAQLKKDGSFGSRGRSDLADPDEFAALLAHVRRRLGELADGILDGEIAIRPYMLGRQTPCPSCEFRGVCRFESRRGYHLLDAMGREDVLARVTSAGGPQLQDDIGP